MQVSIAGAGGIPALLKRLQSPNTDSQAIAAGALWSLSQNPDNQVILIFNFHNHGQRGSAVSHGTEPRL